MTIVGQLEAHSGRLKPRHDCPMERGSFLDRVLDYAGSVDRKYPFEVWYQCGFVRQRSTHTLRIGRRLGSYLPHWGPSLNPPKFQKGSSKERAQSKISRMVLSKTHRMIRESYHVSCTALENKMPNSQQHLLSCMTTSWCYCWHVKVGREDFGYQVPLVIGRKIPGWHKNILVENRARTIIHPRT
jgi:hypothetical protein